MSVELRAKHCILLGILAWICAGYIYYKEITVFAHWQTTQGSIIEVIEYTKPQNGKEKNYYNFTVEYQDDQAEKKTLKTTFKGNPHFKAGDNFPVLISPDNNNARLYDKRIYKAILFFMSIGTALIIFGTYFLKFRKTKADYKSINLPPFSKK